MKSMYLVKIFLKVLKYSKASNYICQIFLRFYVCKTKEVHILHIYMLEYI